MPYLPPIGRLQFILERSFKRLDVLLEELKAARANNNKNGNQ